VNEREWRERVERESGERYLEREKKRGREGEKVCK